MHKYESRVQLLCSSNIARAGNFVLGAPSKGALPAFEVCISNKHLLWQWLSQFVTQRKSWCWFQRRPVVKSWSISSKRAWWWWRRTTRLALFSSFGWVRLNLIQTDFETGKRDWRERSAYRIDFRIGLPQACKHNELEDIPNLHVMMVLRSLASRHYLTEIYSWRWHYYTLTNEGIEYLREVLHLPQQVFPSTLTKQRPTRPTLGGGEVSEGGKGKGKGKGAWNQDKGAGAGANTDALSLWKYLNIS